MMNAKYKGQYIYFVLANWEILLYHVERNILVRSSVKNRKVKYHSSHDPGGKN